MECGVKKLLLSQTLIQIKLVKPAVFKKAGFCIIIVHMKEMALYRKYRPNDFDGVIGQDHVVSVLKRSIATNNVAHAYIFSGSRGIGKTSIARIFSKELGVNPTDILEIDAASHRGIDDIRELRDSVHTLPFSSSFKVYIIDEVHMLTKDAWNALLKTLEEPPTHVIFMLATTDPEKIPDTIVSRCQMFKLKKPSNEELSSFAISVAEKEGYTLKPDASHLIALLGDGSFRDLLGVLQKAITISKNNVLDAQEISSVLGAPQKKYIIDILHALTENNADVIHKSLHELYKSGADAEMTMKLLLASFRALLLLRITKDSEAVLSQFSQYEQQELQALSQKKSKVFQSASLVIFLEMFDYIKKSPLPFLPIEIACLKIIE